ncbi:MAG: hypothetical protein ACRENG_35460, partial [bacterium]
GQSPPPVRMPMRPSDFSGMTFPFCVYLNLQHGEIKSKIKFGQIEFSLDSQANFCYHLPLIFFRGLNAQSAVQVRPRFETNYYRCHAGSIFFVVKNCARLKKDSS